MRHITTTKGSRYHKVCQRRTTKSIQYLQQKHKNRAKENRQLL